MEATTEFLVRNIVTSIKVIVKDLLIFD
jgi:hypothetical protein